MVELVERPRFWNVWNLAESQTRPSVLPLFDLSQEKGVEATSLS